MLNASLYQCVALVALSSHAVFRGRSLLLFRFCTPGHIRCGWRRRVVTAVVRGTVGFGFWALRWPDWLFTKWDPYLRGPVWSVSGILVWLLAIIRRYPMGRCSVG